VSKQSSSLQWCHLLAAAAAGQDAHPANKIGSACWCCWPSGHTAIDPHIVSAQVSLVRCGRPHRSFCQFRRTTWTLLLVVSLLLLQDSGTCFLWTVEVLYLLLHLRTGLRHFSLLRHNPLCSTRLWTMALYKCIDWLIDWWCCCYYWLF